MPPERGQSRSTTVRRGASARSTGPRRATAGRVRRQATTSTTRVPESDGFEDQEVASEPDPEALLECSRLTTEAWYKSKRTTKAYTNYVKAGKAWLQKWVAEETASGEGMESGQEGVTQSPGDRRALFSGAFDEAGEHTPNVLRMYIAFKCEHQKLGFSTAEGIRSAFKSYFEM